MEEERKSNSGLDLIGQEDALRMSKGVESTKNKRIVDQNIHVQSVPSLKCGSVNSVGGPGAVKSIKSKREIKQRLFDKE
jgi:hypothetical protein